MTITLAVNENNDIYATPGGILATAEGIESVKITCTQAMRAKKGEMLYAKDQGVDYDGTVFTGAVDLVKFEASARNTLNAVDGVTLTKAFDVEVIGNTVAYTATIETIYGTDTISGTV